MSSLRERVEGLVAKWRERSANFVMQTGNPAKLELEDCADDLAAALVAEGQSVTQIEKCPNCGLRWRGETGYCRTPGCGYYFGAAAPSLHKEELRITARCTWINDITFMARTPEAPTTQAPCLNEGYAAIYDSGFPREVLCKFHYDGKLYRKEDVSGYRLFSEPAALHKEGAGGEPILTRVKLYLDSWAEHPAKELGEQATVYVHSLLRELYEAAASPAGRAEQVSGSTRAAKRGEAP